jgi:translation initiation factor 4G
MTPSREGKGHYGQMQSRGKSGARSSRDQERESALAAARHLTSGHGSNRTTPVGSRNQSREASRNRDSSRNRDAPAPPDSDVEKRVTAAAPAPTEHTTEYIDKKTKSLIDEYLQIHDIKEAVQCVKDLESPKTIHQFVSTALNHVLERSSKARKVTGTFLNHLVKQNIVSADAYMKGLQETLEFAEDMQIDIPMIWQYLGELIGPMVQDGCLPLTSLRRICEPLSSMAGVLVAEILHDMSHTLGHIKVGELWRSSKLQWSDFLKPNENVGEFVRKHKLEFTQSAEAPPSPDGKSLPVNKIWDELDRLIVVMGVVNEEVIDWIEANVGEAHVKEPAFIRALMTAICTSAITGEGTQCRVDEEKVKKRLVLLLKYLDHKETLELQALYALQALVHRLEHPPSVLRTFFDTFYDEDIISEDAFNQWENSDDPAEQAGKGVAKTSVVQFFTWLHEAEEESQEDS